MSPMTKQGIQDLVMPFIFLFAAIGVAVTLGAIVGTFERFF